MAAFHLVSMGKSVSRSRRIQTVVRLATAVFKSILMAEHLLVSTLLSVSVGGVQWGYRGYIWESEAADTELTGAPAGP